MHENDAEKALDALQEESEARGEPPTLEEIRTALRAFAGEARSARDIFEGRLIPDPQGKGWGWDALRRKVRTALEAMETGAWTPDLEIGVPANSIAEAVEAAIPPDVLEALTLYESLGAAIGATNLLAYGAEHLPEKVPAGSFTKRVEEHRAKLTAIRARMEDMSEPDGPQIRVKR
jgi:hypothetical protein